MEAASMGLPVICSRIEGNVDMVEHLQSGLLFEKMNIADLLEKWNYALKNPGKMEQMALALQQKIHTHFDRNIVLKAMYNAYLKLLDEAG
jgi:glycosyltransferase involved in cell wall biosynthesis